MLTLGHFYVAITTIYKEEFEKHYYELETYFSEEPAEEKDVEIVPLDVPPGTKWEDITINFIDKEYVTITINGNKPINKHYAEIGFKDSRQNKPIKAWIVFMSFACVGNGINTKNTSPSLPTLTNRIEEIKRRLKILFKGISGNPIPFDNGSWKPVFNIPYNPNLKAHLTSLETQDDLDD